MQRVTALWQASPNKIVGALFALALAAMMAVASGASFTSTSANAGNVVTAGNLMHGNSVNGAILDVEKMIPDDTESGTVTITNTGDVTGVFTLSQDNIVDSDQTDKLSEKLDLTVTDVTGGGSDEVYTGKLGAMSEEDLGEIEAGDDRTYEFEVHFPDSGTPGGDNVYKGDSVSVRFNWESVTE